MTPSLVRTAIAGALRGLARRLDPLEASDVLAMLRTLAEPAPAAVERAAPNLEVGSVGCSTCDGLLGIAEALDPVKLATHLAWCGRQPFTVDANGFGRCALHTERAAP